MRNEHSNVNVGKSTKKSSAASKVKVVTAVRKRKSDSGKQPPVTSDERQLMIAEAAYFIASERGFTPGNELDDWIAAEQHIDLKLAEF